jgi:A/G-specific adenine glycosylase
LSAIILQQGKRTKIFILFATLADQSQIRMRRMPADKQFARALLRWYDQSRRELPWRPPLGQLPDPYVVLVSELMLQQTQVATVIPYFQRFMARFPTSAILADASEQEVLRLWQGLGYYSRARNLQSAARMIQSEFAGKIPSSLDQLQTLPGIGRYTAGAIASIGFNRRAPIVDGNVARVLCRLERIQADPKAPKTVARIWKRAEEILPANRSGDFNSALMELGATVCTPRNPICLLCPVEKFCKAEAASLQESIPTIKRSKPTPLERRWTICMHHQNRWLIEQRPKTGRWAQMWQFVTLEAGPKNPTAQTIQRHVGLEVRKPKLIGQLKHALTHRRYEFAVFVAQAENDGLPDCARPRRWARLEELANYPLPRPHLKIAEMLLESSCQLPVVSCQERQKVPLP